KCRARVRSKRRRLCIGLPRRHFLLLLSIRGVPRRVPTSDADLVGRGGRVRRGKLGGMVHEVAAAGFSDAADYEAARPSYPPEAVAWLVENLRIEPGKRVVDLAAGTGKLTRLL